MDAGGFYSSAGTENRTGELAGSPLCVPAALQRPRSGWIR